MLWSVEYRREASANARESPPLVLSDRHIERVPHRVICTHVVNVQCAIIWIISSSLTADQHMWVAHTAIEENLAIGRRVTLSHWLALRRIDTSCQLAVVSSDTRSSSVPVSASNATLCTVWIGENSCAESCSLLSEMARRPASHASSTTSSERAHRLHTSKGKNRWGGIHYSLRNALFNWNLIVPQGRESRLQYLRINGIHFLPTASEL